MNVATPTPRVLVRVLPRILAETLCVSLRARQVDAVVCPIPERRRVPRAPQQFSVAVANEPLPGELLARSVVVLDEGGVTRSVVRDGREEPCDTGGDLADLLALIVGLAGQPGEREQLTDAL